MDAIRKQFGFGSPERGLENATRGAAIAAAPSRATPSTATNQSSTVRASMPNLDLAGTRLYTIPESIRDEFSQVTAQARQSSRIQHDLFPVQRQRQEFNIHNAPPSGMSLGVAPAVGLPPHQDEFDDGRWAVPDLARSSNGLNWLKESKDTEECVTCMEEFHNDNLYYFPSCQHPNCWKCIKAMGQHALKSRPFKPAKCCHVIPINILEAAGAFSDEEVKEYHRKVEELTHPARRLYCFNTDCGAFIPQSQQSRRVGMCGQCGKKTCRTCLQKSHYGVCDEAMLKEAKVLDSELLEVAGANGWKQCPNCRSVVQKRGGCNHMTASAIHVARLSMTKGAIPANVIENKKPPKKKDGVS
ncbi:hypothetical protein F5Y15DRAFT_420868 [Xylariaceae sp. FL0016]|nr:hypothetical protein F5Y15DRAFT_420868 [Xylariaceae sp. FL0016]